MRMSNNNIQSDAAHVPTDTQELIPNLCQGKAVLWLILFSEALVLVLILLSKDELLFEWLHFGQLSLYVQWVVLVTAACLCRIRLHVKQLSLKQLLGVSFVTILLVNLLISGLTLYGMNRVMGESLGWQWVIRNQVISAVIGVMLLHYFYAQLQWRLQNRSELQSRVQALQSRIRPHFLFNSMNIIASLIHADPDKAEQAVEDLSELFRASLKEAGTEVSLDQELALCKKYVHIEQLRLGQRLNVQWDVNTQSNISIPMLTLQPLLENAILHGIQPLADGGTVSVSIREEDDLVQIDVTNPVPTQPLSTRHEQGNQMALDNIQHRLRALYGDGIQMRSQQTEDRYVCHIEYPASDVGMPVDRQP